jgi:hypothetical protein
MYPTIMPSTVSIAHLSRRPLGSSKCAGTFCARFGPKTANVLGHDVNLGAFARLLAVSVDRAAKYLGIGG